MLYLIHAFAGCIIGGYIGSSVVAVILLAVISHFLIDMLPHWDGPYNRRHFEKTGKLKAHKSIFAMRTFDFLIGIAILIFMIYKFPFLNSSMMIAGAIAALAPDIIKAGYFSPLKKNRAYMKYLQFHSKIQNEAGWKKGMFSQIMFLGVLILMSHFL